MLSPSRHGTIGEVCEGTFRRAKRTKKNQDWASRLFFTIADQHLLVMIIITADVDRKESKAVQHHYPNAASKRCNCDQQPRSEKSRGS